MDRGVKFGDDRKSDLRGPARPAISGDCSYPTGEGRGDMERSLH